MEHAQALLLLAARLNDRVEVARGAAHAAFDPLWKSGRMSRSAAYRWLGQQMNLPKEECHMKQFTVAQCLRVIELCKSETA